MPVNVPRPFLKWAGGKTQITAELLKRVPPVFRSYHEPFIGGGAFFFKLFRDGRIKGAKISDLNAELIDTYLAVRDHVEEVIRILFQYPHDEDFFYSLRAQDPWLLELPARAARMIYLNKTGYNGLYRVNKRGIFNVPFGRYKTPAYCDVNNLISVSIALQNVDICHAPFEAVLNNSLPGDFVYFDHPYVPLSKTSNFTSYHANGFSKLDQTRLHAVCVELSRRSIYFMLSNSDVEFIRELFADGGYFTVELMVNRAINSNGKGRGKLTELLITNYPMIN